MLSDHEWRALRALERQLRDDDPDFPRRFAVRARGLNRRRPGWAVVAIVVLAGLAVVLVLGGAPGAALALVAVAGLLALLRYGYRAAARDDPDDGTRR